MRILNVHILFNLKPPRQKIVACLCVCGWVYCFAGYSDALCVGAPFACPGPPSDGAGTSAACPLPVPLGQRPLSQWPPPLWGAPGGSGCPWPWPQPSPPPTPTPLTSGLAPPCATVQPCRTATAPFCRPHLPDSPAAAAVLAEAHHAPMPSGWVSVWMCRMEETFPGQL